MQCGADKGPSHGILQMLYNQFWSMVDFKLIRQLATCKHRLSS